MTTRPAGICSHVWIDPEDLPIARAPYAPMIGPLRRQMKHGRQYVCRECGAVLAIPSDLERHLETARDR
jgi:hypothetical protein